MIRKTTVLIAVAASANMLLAAPAAGNALSSDTGRTGVRPLIVNGVTGHGMPGKKADGIACSAAGAILRGHRGLRADAPENFDIVEERPEGTASAWKRSSSGYAVDSWGDLTMGDDKNLAVTMVQGEDGKVWLNTPMSLFPVNVWYHADIDGDVMTIPGGQCIYREMDWDTDEWFYVWLVACEYVGDEESGWWYPAENPDYRMVLEDGVWRSENPDLMLALCAWDEEEQAYYWSGYGDHSIVLAPQDETPLAPPASLETEAWALTKDDGSGYFVNVGRDGASLYMQGFYSKLPEAWVRLDVDGDKAVLKSGQYLGADPESWHYAYMHGSFVREEWNDDWEEYVDVVYPAESLVFNYNADMKTLDSEGAMVVSSEADRVVNVDGHVNMPRIAYQTRTVGTPPAAPVELEVYPYDEYFGKGTIIFQAPCVDVEGNLLHADRLYYNIFVDGELFEFFSDEYERLPEASMTDIPWAYNDFWDFYTSEVYHTLYYYFTGFKTLGVQSLYVEDDDAENPTVVRSEMVTYQVSGIDGVSEEAGDVVSVRYFDMQGREVSDAAKGILIRSVRNADGSISNRKMVR